MSHRGRNAVPPRVEIRRAPRGHRGKPSRSRGARFLLLAAAAAGLVTTGFFVLTGPWKGTTRSLSEDSRAALTAAGGGAYIFEADASVAPSFYTSRLQLLGGTVTAVVGRVPLEVVFPFGEVRILRGKARVTCLQPEEGRWPEEAFRLVAADVLRSAAGVCRVEVLRGEGRIAVPGERRELKRGRISLVVQGPDGKSHILER